MEQTDELIGALKKCLKSRGMTYQQLAEKLEISEASVKRIFAEHSFSLQRLEQICRLLDMDFYDLAKLTRMFAGNRSSVLSPEQEQDLADQPELLTFFYLLLNGWTPTRIAQEYGLSETQNVRFLARLDRLKLIDLLPSNQVRLRTSRNIAWQPGGPVRRLYERQVKQEFLQADFAGEDELLRFESGELSVASVGVLRQKMRELCRQFNELVELDMTLPAAEKRSVGLLTALRPWVFSMIAQQKRGSMAKRFRASGRQ
ncbi:MAG: helix-turn-helix transcriptional regulator [Candidatus Competibacteraceae bacterium]|jgi:DNA-binding Xre family transcriptional regulator|nr:helix-turn-helix transcriptional regulator [Candidatus Competibacteraceae bacterium]